MSILALAVASFALSQSAASATVDTREAERLKACVAKIEVDADEAYEDGLAWTYQGNRPGARQCTALALIALGREDEGAARLEQLANSVDGGTLEQRAEYLTQSGNAWLQAGATFDDFSEAIEQAQCYAPKTPETLNCNVEVIEPEPQENETESSPFPTVLLPEVMVNLIQVE